MPPAAKLALRDFRRAHRGLWIFLGCLALGVGAITAVMAAASGIIGAIERDARAVLGGDVAVSTQFRPLAEDQLEYLRSNAAGIAQFVEMRTLMRAEDAGDSALVEVKAVDSAYPLTGRLETDGALAYPESIGFGGQRWGALVDPALVKSGSVQVGSRISLGGVEFAVTGVIAHEPDRIGGSGNFGFWPRVLVHLDALENSALLGDTSRHRREYRLVLPDGTTSADFIARLNEAFDAPHWEVRDYTEAAPSLKDIVERMSVLMSLAGLATLLIGGVGVSNAVRAYLETRISTIAILKCLGGWRRLVLQTYLLQILALTGTGVAIGLGLGYLLQLVIGPLLQRWVGLPLAFAPDAKVLSIAVAYGFGTGLLFSLKPLSNALDTSPAALFRQVVARSGQKMSFRFVIAAASLAVALAAIAVGTAPQQRFAIWFVVSVVCAWTLFRLMGALVVRVSKLVRVRRSPALRLAIANLHRPGSSTSDIVLAIGLGLSVLVTVALVSTNLDRQINGLIPEQAPAFFFLDIQPHQRDGFAELLSDAEGIENVKTLPYVRGRITRIRDQEPLDALRDPDSEWLIEGDRAFTYSAKAPDNAQLVAGEWWPEDYAGPPLLSIHEEVARSFAMSLGDTITMNILGREIIGEVRNVRSLAWQSMQLNFAIMLSPEPLRSAPHTYISTVGTDGGGDHLLQDAVVERFPNITAIRVKDVLDRVSEYMKSAKDAAQGISLITVLAGALVLAGVVISENRRRAYEGVLLKMLGAPKRFVLAAYLLEYLMQGGIAACLAILTGAVASWAVLTALMGWDWTFVPLNAAQTAMLGLAMSVTIGLYGIVRVLNHRPLRYLRNQ